MISTDCRLLTVVLVVDIYFEELQIFLNSVWTVSVEARGWCLE